MFWLVENNEQLKELEDSNFEEVFVEIIPYSNTIHPVENSISAFYIRPLKSTKGYIASIDHSEALPLNVDDVKHVLNKFKRIYVRDKKKFLHYLILKELYDTRIYTNSLTLLL